MLLFPAGGSSVPGVAASTALAQGRCLNNTDCKSEALECNTAEGAVTIYTCNKDTGIITNATRHGTCVKTACQTCRDCMAAAQQFALQHATDSDPAKLAEAWKEHCSTSGLANTTQCAAVAAQITSSPNLGKRAAGLCFALNQCSAGSCGSSMQLDTCTVSGQAGGMLVPGVSATATKPQGRCFSKVDCAPPADTCDKSEGGKLCVCEDGVDTCSAQVLGTCAVAGSGCDGCKKCLSVVQPFVKQVLADGSKYTTWMAVCTEQKFISPAQCAAVATKFGSDVNKYRRAGVICTELMFCKASLASDRTCVLDDLELISGKPAGSSARFDTCTGTGLWRHKNAANRTGQVHYNIF